MDSSKKHVRESPEVKANFLSKLFFCWILPFFKIGYQKDLDVQDLYNATKGDLSGTLGDELEKYWKEELQKCKGKQNKASLKSAIWKAFWKSYAIYGVYFFIQVIFLRSLQPILLAVYIDYFGHTKESYQVGSWIINKKEYGWILAVGVILLAFVNMVIFHYCSLGCQRVGMRVRIACCSLVYRKMLRLSQASLGETAAGQLVNLMSNDVQRFDLASSQLHYIWIMPFLFVTAFYIIYDSVGWAALAAMLAMTVQSVPLQGYLSKVQGVLRYKIAQRTDFRVKLMSEIVSGIQVIKMYAWEKPFEKMVENSRNDEIKFITKTSYIKGFSLALMVVTERFALYVTLIAYVLIGHRLTSDTVFSMSLYINIVQMYMCIFFPMALGFYAEAKVTIRRLEDFLVLEENVIVQNREATIMDEEKRGLVQLDGATASWLPNPVVNTLIDVTLKISPGTLCCVVGNVGSGKSSLLQMLLKELPVKKGSMELNGQVSYASQEPWLFVSSVRNNILFGQPYLKNRYSDIVKYCALERDFKQFLHGDKTLVGERGVSLSGGQRARINLARAVYVDADIYLFDDPLSAVDTHVGKHLFEQCIKGYLKGKTRILATHQLQFLKQADMIIVLNNGTVEKIGTYDELSDTALESLKRQESKEEIKDVGDNVKKDIAERLQSIASVGSSVGKEVEDEEQQETQELIEKGNLSTSLYIEYYRTGASVLFLIFMVVLFLVAQMVCNGCDLWVAHWTYEERLSFENLILKSYIGTHHPNSSADLLRRLTVNTTAFEELYMDENFLPTQTNYMLVYTVFIIGAILLTTSRSILFYKMCMNASKGLHNKMFGNVLKAPMFFFNTNPSGRILNRFSKDIGTVDEVLPKAAVDALTAFLVMCGILGMVFFVTPIMMVPAALLALVFYFFKSIYLSSAQDIKRIEGVTRAPVFSHVSATLYGLSTIRSSKAEEMVIHEFDSLQDQHTSSWYLFIACSGAFGFYMDCISTTFLALVTFQFLVFEKYGSIGEDIGLLISSSMILIGMLQLGVKQTTEVTSNMTSVERVVQYTKLQKEDEISPEATSKPSNWPSAGKVTFKNTYLRYTLEDPPVLKNLNMIIQPGEKVGIVGRTGAGKSTLIASLFRLAPIEGTIAIDDIDTSTVSLEYLRSNISIIPQEPILFSASIRYNLDPFDKADDETIWRALSDVELKSSIESLDQKVSEGGSNFSAGQRQLVCLARAIIRNNKILVMDEATANVDTNTDSLIQKTIGKNFKDCTMLTIAHRLNTIMDYDKVLVMEMGEAVEFAPPHELLQIPEGYFTKMVEQTGPVMEAHLRKVAEDAYLTK
ncbi:unnamed protein product [Phaedon cochleariae]|uniref:Uncharacterized protein n=1 Tax=Phaedon cochleariae TaxID=80249 RepID=A0A9N9SF09_PHACE|nr:unnamed protein product [Phaedon cochleariae]